MNGLWICADERPELTKFYYFSKSFSAKKDSKLVIDVCADSRFQLYVNGNLAAEGPCQGSSFQRYYDTADCSAFLTDGENIITVKVQYLFELGFISVFRRSKPALWLQAHLETDGQDCSFRSDGSWECLRDDSTEFIQGQGCHISIPQFEVMGAEEILTPVKVSEMYQTNLAAKCYNPWGLSEPYVLEKRPIPPMETMKPQKFKVIKQGDGFIELDTGEYTTAKVSLKVRGEAGKQIRVIYSECYLTPNGNGGYFKGMRDNTDGILPGVWDIVKTNGKEQTLKPFWYRAFRFMRIEYEGDFELIDAEFSKFFYPMDITGTFTSSDKTLEDMWRVSINTVRCCMHEIYVDCPFYEQQQYDMDSALEAIFTYRFTSDTAMQRKCITDMAHSQMSDGMLQANYPSTSVQIIPDFSLFWIFMLRDYLNHTGDRKFVLSMTGTVDKVLEGFRSLLDERGLVGVTPYWPFIDWVPTWPNGTPIGGLDEPLTVTCLMYSAALAAAADICVECGRAPLAADYLARSREMNENVFKYCYDKDAKLFRNTPSRNDFSEHTTLWAILADAVTGDEARELMERTLSADVSRCTFSMNHYMFRALEKSGCYKYADRVLDGWRKMLDMHCTTWCENPDSPRSECHGWSSAPAYELSAMYLGVKPAKPGYEEILIKPYTDFANDASGTVPTPYGLISVSWKKQDGKFTLDASIPTGLKATVELPDHSPIAIEGNTFHIEL